MSLTCRTVGPIPAALIAAGHLTIITLPKRPKVVPARLGIYAGTKITKPIPFATRIVVAKYRVDYGAIVATANVVDCVPILDAEDPDDPCGDMESPFIAALHDGKHGAWIYGDGQDLTGRNLSDQLPYADFTPGRWALILDDVQPTTTRCPACWGTGTNAAGDEVCLVCPLNEFGAPNGTCPPIHTPGRPGFWEWTP